MAWYLRKSVKVGPVRFNLSKSGIGTSVGVKGFRVGVRPNGKSYVHAGRHGLYYRQEFEGQNYHPESQQENINELENVNSSHPDAIRYNSATSQELTSESRRELIESLNKSYKNLRLDYLCGAVLLILSFILLQQSTILGIVLIVLSIIATIAVAVWESKRRTITINYDFEDEEGNVFKQIITAFNNLASSNNIWALIESRNIYDSHEAKLNAGASNLISRSGVQVGEGKPPWVKTNVNVPVFKAREQTLYMMPDGIFVYDNKGVGFVEYEDISLNHGTTRFIEEHPPKDAKVVDTTWKHPNKNGGPDKRFNDNFEIPICLYGELKIKSKTGLFLYLMTSKDDSPVKFKREFSSLTQLGN